MRQTKFAKYLPQFNWRPFILTGKHHFFFQDEELLHEVERSCKIVRVPYFDPRLIFRTKTKPLNSGLQIAKPDKKTFNRVLSFSKSLFKKVVIPDVYAGWVLGAVKKALMLIRNEKIDLIYSVDNPCSNHLVALILKRITGIPWVADFKDPWVASFGANVSPKIFPLSWLDYILQRNVLHYCDKCVSSDKRIDKILKTVSKARQEDKFHIIFNGFDKEDFRGEVNKYNNDTLTISYLGTIYEVMAPHAFLEAIMNLLKKGAIKEDDIRVQFIGQLEHPRVLNNETFQTLLRRGIVKYVEMVSHKTSIRYMRESDALLLISANVFGGKDLIPSKTFEYLASGTPIIALSEENSAVAEIVLKAQSGYNINYYDIAKIEKLLVKLTEQIKGGPLILPQDKKYINLFDRKNSAKRLSEIFNSLKENV